MDVSPVFYGEKSLLRGTHLIIVNCDDERLLSHIKIVSN